MIKPLPFSTKFGLYTPCPNRILDTRWEDIYHDVHLFNLFPNVPFTAYKNHKTLRSLFSYKRRTFNDTPTQPYLQAHNAEPFKFLTFNHPKT